MSVDMYSVNFLVPNENDQATTSVLMCPSHGSRSQPTEIRNQTTCVEIKYAIVHVHLQAIVPRLPLPSSAKCLQ